MKIFEALFLTLLTVSVFYLASYIKYLESTDPDNDTKMC